MRRIGLVTCEELPHLHPDDRLLMPLSSGWARLLRTFPDAYDQLSQTHGSCHLHYFHDFSVGHALIGLDHHGGAWIFRAGLLKSTLQFVLGDHVAREDEAAVGENGYRHVGTL